MYHICPQLTDHWAKEATGTSADYKTGPEVLYILESSHTEFPWVEGSNKIAFPCFLPPFSQL